ncbi:hypothetical protein ACA910_000136 [Epithemia clementina (nom. ined.)]
MYRNYLLTKITAAILTLHFFLVVTCHGQACPVASVIDKDGTAAICPLDRSTEIEVALGEIDLCVSQRLQLNDDRRRRRNRTLRGDQRHEGQTSEEEPQLHDPHRELQQHPLCGMCQYVGQFWFCYPQFCKKFQRMRDLSEEAVEQDMSSTTTSLEMESSPFASVVAESETPPRVSLFEWESYGLVKVDNAVCRYRSMKANPDLAKCLEKVITVIPDDCD